jgi:hypothetical protein
LRTLQLQRERLLGVIAVSEITRETLGNLQTWLPRLRNLIVVSSSDTVLEALRPASKTPKSSDSSLPEDLLFRCRTLHEQARASSKRLLVTHGTQLAQSIAQLDADAAPLVLAGSLTQATVALDALAPLLDGRPAVGAFGISVLLSLHQLPALLGHVSVSCASEQVALRTLAGEALPSLAALTGAG